MSANYYRIVSTDGRTSIAFMHEGAGMSVDDTHPSFNEIREALLDEDYAEAHDLFDAAKALTKRFNKLTDRVSVRGNSLYFDNEVIENDLTDKILNYYQSGEDFKPLVNFLEKLYVNNNSYVRSQLFRFIQDQNITILPNGDFIGHKGVLAKGDGVFESRNSGHAIVDGEDIHGRVPQKVGSVVEMPRSEVTFDENTHCAAGLHVGTYDYASRWGDGSTLLVAVNPRDVVSVPADSYGDKLRTCRYRVLDTTEAEVTGTLSRDYDNLLEDDGSFSYYGDDEDLNDDTWDEDWVEDDDYDDTVTVTANVNAVATAPKLTAWGGVEVKRGLGLRSRKTGRTALRVDSVNTDGSVRVYDIGAGKYRDADLRSLVKSYYA